MLFALVAASASAAPFKGSRYDWFYDGGYFHKMINSDRGWTEMQDGHTAFNFEESARNDYYVELYDASRQAYVRLYDDHFEFKGPNDSGFFNFRGGHWDDRRNISYFHNDRFAMDTGGIWKWYMGGNNDPYRLYKEIGRSDIQIVLFNAQFNETIFIEDYQTPVAIEKMDADGNRETITNYAQWWR
jgi:hypothetical protein